MISPKLKSVILKSLELDDYDLRDSTVASDVPGWDSLSHIKVILAVEKEFELKFKTMELLRLKNVGDLQSLIDARKA